MIDLSSHGWHENTVYPGTHWLYYSKRRDYRARVDCARWTGGKYEWRVFGNWPGEDIVGQALTLEAAQSAAQAVMDHSGFQLAMF